MRREDETYLMSNIALRAMTAGREDYKKVFLGRLSGRIGVSTVMDNWGERKKPTGIVPWKQVWKLRHENSK